MEAKSIIHLVGTTCPPEMEEKFDAWYSDRHVPDLLKFKGVKKVTRYKRVYPSEEHSRFLTIYEFDSQQDFEAYFSSPERNAAMEDWENIQKELGASATMRVQYEVIKTWQR